MVKPEDEAAKLRKQQPAPTENNEQPEQPQQAPEQQPEQPQQTPEEKPTTPEQPQQTPKEQPEQPRQDSAEAKHKAVMDEIVRRTTEGSKAAPTASDAGRAHTVDKSRFSTKTVRVKDGRRTKRVKLRLKRPAPQRLRKSGGDIEEVPTPQPDKKTTKNNPSWASVPLNRVYLLC